MRWPASIQGVPVSYAVMRRDMERWLIKTGILPTGFSHFGVVINDKATACAALAEMHGPEPRTDWVASLGLYVTRAELEGTEIEWIAPVQESFFSKHLRAFGESLHHASFRVEDIDDCVARLRSAEVSLVNDKPLAGSHGKILFARPAEFGPHCIEFCQATSA